MLEEERVFYYYPRDKKNKRMGHSIAIILKENKVFFGYSHLSDKDKFNKKIGRQIAESRAREQIQRFENRKQRNVTL